MTHAAEDTDLVISGAVRALLAARGLAADDLRPVLGVSRGAVFTKLNSSSPWKAREVAALAEFFDVSVGALYDGLGGIVTGTGRGSGAGRRKNPSPANRRGAAVSAAHEARPEGLEPPTF